MTIKKLCLHYLLPVLFLSGGLFFIRQNLNDTKLEAAISCIILGFLIGVALSIKMPSEEKAGS